MCTNHPKTGSGKEEKCSCDSNFFTLRSSAMESSPHFLILHVTVNPVVSGALESPGPAFDIPFEMAGSLSRRLPVSKKTSPTSWFNEFAIFFNILIRSRPTSCEMSVVKMMEPVVTGFIVRAFIELCTPLLPERLPPHVNGSRLPSTLIFTVLASPTQL